MTTIVTYDQFSSTNLIGSEPDPDSFKKGNETISFNNIKLSYQYGTSQNPLINDLFFEFPELSASSIRVKEEDATGKNGPYKKQTFSMMLIFDILNEKNKDTSMLAINKFNELHAGCSQILGANKGKLKIFDYNSQSPGAAFKNPIYRPRDENTGEIVAGKNPSLWVKMRSFKNNRTLFTDVDGHVIDWSLLKDVEIKCIPLVHIEKIFVEQRRLLVFRCSYLVLSSQRSFRSVLRLVRKPH